MTDINTLYSLAKQFRAAMESADFSDTEWLNRFPKESCDITCKLLGLFLYDHGVRDFAIMSGERPDDVDGKHQWLQHGEILIDITGDQFGCDSQPAVIVTCDSPWHAARHGQRIREFDAEYYHMLISHHFCGFTREMYDRILKNIPP